jgi:hypothetical protein
LVENIISSQALLINFVNHHQATNMSHAFELMESKESEKSIEEAFALAFTDETLHDITLLASDGEQVPANRTILAIRSTVFRKMLFGNFQEATKDNINVDYPGTVVKAVVEYIHTNDAEQLVELDVAKRNGKDITDDCLEDFQTLLTLTAAAAYYGLPKLCHGVQKCLSSYLEAFPLLAFATLEACSQEGPAISEDLKQSALSKVAKLLAEGDFDATTFERCSQTAVKYILVNGKAFLPDHQCFKLIDLWRQVGSTDQNRCSNAKKLVNDHVGLHFIDPEDLSTTVASSGLVTLEQLVEAYKSQAIQAKKKFKVSFTKKQISFMCPNPTWKGANSVTFANRGNWKSDTLECPILVVGGRYTWTVVINGVPDVWLGVVLSSHSHAAIISNFAGYTTGCFGLSGRSGIVYSSGSQVTLFGEAAKLKDGDHVNLTLDLSSDAENNGTLSVSVKGKPTIRILADMCSLCDGIGFVPALSGRNTRVTVESIEEF